MDHPVSHTRPASAPASGKDGQAQAIEVQLDADRAALQRSLAALGARLSLDSLWSDSATLIQSNAGPYAQALDKAVRANPLALAVTSVGLAWLVLGRSTAAAPVEPPPLAGTRFEALTRWEDEGGPVLEPPLAGQNLPDQNLPDQNWPDEPWMQQADRLRDRAAALIGRINMAARDRLAPVADLARSRADVMAALAQDLGRVMSAGLEPLTGTARAQALAAREAVYSVRMRAMEAGAQAVRRHPMLSAGACVVAGAALAAALPQTATEHRLFGAARDRLVAEGQRLLAEEMARARQAASALATALRSDLGRVQASLTDAAADTLAARR